MAFCLLATGMYYHVTSLDGECPLTNYLSLQAYFFTISLAFADQKEHLLESLIGLDRLHERSRTTLSLVTHYIKLPQVRILPRSPTMGLTPTNCWLYRLPRCFK